jgi:predicted xylose isomerase-like sugar epimerase
VNQESEAELLEHLRVALKMIESIYQITELKGELDKQTVRSWSLRAKAAIDGAIDLAARSAG